MFHQKKHRKVTKKCTKQSDKRTGKGKCENAKIGNIFVEKQKIENEIIEENTEFKARHLRNLKQIVIQQPINSAFHIS